MPTADFCLARARRVIFILLGALAFICVPAQAQDAPAYHVEVIVLAHTSPFAAGERFDIDERLFSDAIELEPEAREPQAIGRFEALAAEQLMLGETVRRLGNASRFRVLGHFGWKQDAVDTVDALAKGISGGATGGRVNGNILLSRSRFLRLDLDLSFAAGSETVTLRQTRRRVQTGKPHYVDHPYFGVIIQVSRAP